MSTPIQPYLGTGIAEMLANRRQQEFESSLRQQESTAPVLAQSIAPFVNLALTQPGGMQTLQQMLAAGGLRMPFAGTGASGTVGAMPGMVGAQTAAPGAESLIRGAGLDPAIIKQALAAKAFGVPTQLQGQQERVNEALQSISQTETIIPQIRQSFDKLTSSLAGAGVDLGRAVSDVSGLAPGWLESASGLATRQELARVYNQLMQSPLSGMPKTQPLDAEALKRPDQMKSVLDSLLPQIEFQDVLSRIVRDLQNEAQAAGRMLTEAEIAEAKNVARQLAEMRMAKKRAASQPQPK